MINSDVAYLIDNTNHIYGLGHGHHLRHSSKVDFQDKVEKFNIKIVIKQVIMTPNQILTPLKDLKVAKHQIQAHGLTPNTSIQNKPLLFYRSAFRPNRSASQIEDHLSAVGVVTPQWRYTVSALDDH